MDVELTEARDAREAIEAKLENLQGELDSKTLLLDGTFFESTSDGAMLYSC